MCATTKIWYDLTKNSVMHIASVYKGVYETNKQVILIQQLSNK
jgi:hypothetical protein